MNLIRIFNTEYVVPQDSPRAAMDAFFEELSDSKFVHRWEFVADLPGGGFAFNAYVNDKLSTYGTIVPHERRRA